MTNAVSAFKSNLLLKVESPRKRQHELESIDKKARKGLVQKWELSFLILLNRLILMATAAFFANLGLCRSALKVVVY